MANLHVYIHSFTTKINGRREFYQFQLLMLIQREDFPIAKKTHTDQCPTQNVNHHFTNGHQVNSEKCCQIQLSVMKNAKDAKIPAHWEKYPYIHVLC